MAPPDFAMLLPVFAVAVAAAAHAAEPITRRSITDERKAIVTIAQCGKIGGGRITAILAPTPNGPSVHGSFAAGSFGSRRDD